MCKSHRVLLDKWWRYIIENYSLHIVFFCLPSNFRVRYFVPPLKVQDSHEASHVECLQSLNVSTVKIPRLAAIRKCGHADCHVNWDLRLDGEMSVQEDSRWESSKRRCHLTYSVINLVIYLARWWEVLPKVDKVWCILDLFLHLWWSQGSCLVDRIAASPQFCVYLLLGLPGNMCLPWSPAIVANPGLLEKPEVHRLHSITPAQECLKDTFAAATSWRRSNRLSLSRYSIDKPSSRSIPLCMTLLTAARNRLKMTGASTQPCLTPTVTSKLSDSLPPEETLTDMPSSSALTRERKRWRQPNFLRTSHIRGLFPVSKAFVRSTKTANRFWCCSPAFFF